MNNTTKPSYASVARAAALNSLTNPKQQLDGKLRRQLLRNLGIDVGARTRTEPQDDAVRMAKRLAGATIAQLNTWILRLQKRTPRVAQALEDAKAAGMTKAVNSLQIKLDIMNFIFNAFQTEVSFRIANIADIAAKKAAKKQVKFTQVINSEITKP